MDSDNQDKVAQFSAITGANPSTAQATLESSNWNLEDAVGLYFAASDDPHHDHDADMGGDDDGMPEAMHQPPPPSGPSQAPPSAAKSSQKASSKRMKTLKDLQSGGDDEDDEDDEKPRDLFAGGEKSGLAVQDPSNQGGPTDHFRNILNQARQNRGRPGEDEDEAPAGSANFRGPAQTLGGDDAPSRTVGEAAAPAAAGRQRLPRVTRTLHLWQDGVSIDDGPLFRFDDPANADMMAQINQGRAPMSLLDVQPDQEVDLNLDPHKDEKYVKPKAQYKPFGGSGNRLGSPTPGPAPSSSSTTTNSQPAAAPPSSSAQKPAEMSVDQSAPTIQLQIRLGDGTQLRSRFNTTHTIGDVYDFVNRASAASTQRSYALMTTFPSTELSDKAQVLGDMANFKRGGVVVQKWT